MQLNKSNYDDDENEKVVMEEDQRRVTVGRKGGGEAGVFPENRKLNMPTTSGPHWRKR